MTQPCYEASGHAAPDLTVTVSPLSPDERKALRDLVEFKSLSAQRPRRAQKPSASQGTDAATSALADWINATFTPAQVKEAHDVLLDHRGFGKFTHVDVAATLAVRFPSETLRSGFVTEARQDSVSDTVLSSIKDRVGALRADLSKGQSGTEAQDGGLPQIAVLVDLVDQILDVVRVHLDTHASDVQVAQPIHGVPPHLTWDRALASLQKDKALKESVRAREDDKCHDCRFYVDWDERRNGNAGYVFPVYDGRTGLAAAHGVLCGHCVNERKRKAGAW